MSGVRISSLRRPGHT